MSHRNGYPRLTHILSETDAPHIKQKLANWQKKNRGGTYYADLGTIVHEWANFAALAAGTSAFDDFVNPLWECQDSTELWNRGYPWEFLHPKTRKPVRIWTMDSKMQHSWFLKAKSLIPILRKIDRVIWSEGSVDGDEDALYYDDGTIKFTTRPDLVVTFKGKPDPYLVEIKTSKGFYSDTPAPSEGQEWQIKGAEIGYEKYLKTATQLYAQSLALAGVEIRIPSDKHLIWVATNKPKNQEQGACQILKIKHDAAPDWGRRTKEYFGLSLQDTRSPLAIQPD